MAAHDEYRYTIEHSPAYASLIVNLKPNQTVVVEASAMAAMDSCIQMETKVRGGAMQGLKRMLGGESLFMNEFTAQGQGGQLYVSPAVPGDIQHYRLGGGHDSLMVQSSGFVAASPTVNVDSQFQGLRGFFSGESLFLLRLTGEGSVWFSSYGGIVEIPVEGSYVVDTGYIVAFEESLSYHVEMLGGLSWRGIRTGLLGGDGLVCRFQGRGRLWIQSRNLYNLVNFLRPMQTSSSS
ncbi:TIGR00266 family protein [Spirulina sp. CCNP1310]|uniref:TIGR00266 family protein n=1 Tax=Spirulina sp. CCNP1310 TaxID=3110249 RepID=UPI002B21585D|nr:TIGR00266 family protein [Spirulina sp. CCNP1310]MEA5418624.1 TIGR00266 family protein [Spirulina sp. CCNP1310]